MEVALAKFIAYTHDLADQLIDAEIFHEIDGMWKEESKQRVRDSYQEERAQLHEEIDRMTVGIYQ